MYSVSHVLFSYRNAYLNEEMFNNVIKTSEEFKMVINKYLAVFSISSKNITYYLKYEFATDKVSIYKFKEGFFNKISALELQYVLFHRINYMLLDKDILKVLFKYNRNKSIYLVDGLSKNDDDYSFDLVDEECRYVLRR